MFSRLYHSTDNFIQYEHVQRSPVSFDFHLHEECEIYFLISGDVNYFVENKIYPLKCGDLVVTNPTEVHKPSLQSEKTYERYVLRVMPSKVQAFSTPGFDLLGCFFKRSPGSQNKALLNPVQMDEILQMFRKIDQLEKMPPAVHDILLLEYTVELLVHLNLIYSNVSCQEEHPNLSGKIREIIDYIDQHLDGDLSLALLEKKFFIDRFYLSKLFKNSIGSNLHEYIVMKRISKAKKLLSQGLNVTDTCIKCGFNDYSHFLKVFKRTVGVSPGKYRGTLL